MHLIVQANSKAEECETISFDFVQKLLSLHLEEMPHLKSYRTIEENDHFLSKQIKQSCGILDEDSKDPAEQKPLPPVPIWTIFTIKKNPTIES